MLNIPKPNSEWEKQIEEIISLAYTDQTAAMELATSLLPEAEAKYGRESKETMSIHHQLGILCMLLGQYDTSEEHFLAAMAIAEQFEEARMPELAEIAKHLTLLYEAVARLKSGG